MILPNLITRQLRNDKFAPSWNDHERSIEQFSTASFHLGTFLANTNKKLF